MSMTDTVIAFTGQNPALVGFAVFVAAFIEAIPFFGSLFPGSATVLILSGAVGAAGGPVMPIVIWGSLGGFLGDAAGFWIGRRYGLRLRDIWPFSNRPALWDQVAGFLHRHAGKSVILSRFLPGVRAITPIAAGALGINGPVFYVWSVLAAIAWASVYVVPAAIAGQLLSSIGQISSRLVWAALIVVVTLGVAIWLASVAANFIGPRIFRAYRFRILKLYRSRNPLARRTAALLDPTIATIGQHLLWGLMLLASTIGLYGILQSLLASAQIVDIDSSIRTFTRSLRSAPIDQIMVPITAFGDGWVIAISVVLLCLALLVGRAFRTAAIVASVFAATFALLPIINTLLQQDYPVTDIHPSFLTTSFPSSHATLVTLFCASVAALATPPLGVAGRMIAWSFALAVATLVGISRIYLDTQWASDVAGGLLLGVALAAIFAMIRTGFEAELGRSLRYPILACLIFFAVGGVKAVTSYESDLVAYTPRPVTRTLIDDYWLSEIWRELPSRRLDMLGSFEEMISLQVALTPAEMTDLLKGAGWRPAPEFHFRDMLLFLSAARSLDDLPPLPLMESGHLPAASFVRDGPAPESRQVIRFWPTDIVVQSGDHVGPLMIGSVTEERIKRPYGAMTTLEVEAVPADMRSVLQEIASRSGDSVRIFEREGKAGQLLLIAPRK